ncbi:hypothetical protein TSAR_011908 [Trichomalopsis sarcophagae]|uniref:limulus clotting factor C n=1 Tax=Trichomalopsis sarcophagae TaxID=543379 RepID=A0A232EEH0_9HYME|nr:hypothetical protein TSAR_011908 [Trichomalopsis sarcophagae]
MAFSWAFLLYVLLVIQGSQAFSRQKRIVKGVDAKLGEFPYQVSIQNADSNYHHCGGIIIDQYHVLTAGHCLDGFLAEDFQVISGTTDLRKPTFKNYAAAIHVPKTYDQQDSWKDDIAILKMSQPFIFNDLVGPAYLPRKNEEVRASTPATVPGFGRTSEHDQTSKVLKKTTINIEDLSFCNEQYKKSKLNFRDTQICAYSSEHRGICKGDSGGPLIVSGKVVGITSFTNAGCADSSYPSVFTKISKYIDWINSYVQN